MENSEENLHERAGKLFDAIKKRYENETINKALDLLYEEEQRRDKYAREILGEVKRILSK